MGIPTSVSSQPDMRPYGAVRPDVLLYCKVIGKAEKRFSCGEFCTEYAEGFCKSDKKNKVDARYTVGCTEVNFTREKVGVDDRCEDGWYRSDEVGFIMMKLVCMKVLLV